MSTPFEVTDGHPQWVLIKGKLITMAIGQVITDAELAALVPNAAPRSVGPAFHKAVRSLQSTHSRTFTRVRKVGYRMVEATEHRKLARDQQRRAVRRLGAARDKIASADRSRLDETTRRQYDAEQYHIGVCAEMINRVNRRVDVIEGGLRDHKRKTSGDIAAIQATVDRMEEALRRHGLAPLEPAHGGLIDS